MRVSERIERESNHSIPRHVAGPCRCTRSPAFLSGTSPGIRLAGANISIHLEGRRHGAIVEMHRRMMPVHDDDAGLFHCDTHAGSRPNILNPNNWSY